MPTVNTVLSDEQAERIHREAHYGSMPSLADIDALCQTVRGLRARVDEWESHRKGFIELFETAEARVADLKSQLAAVEAERDGLRAERRKRTQPYSDECRIAINELEEKFSTEDDIVELHSAEYTEQRLDYQRSAAIGLCRAKADEWERDASDPRADLKNLIGARGRARADAARELATELEGLE